MENTYDGGALMGQHIYTICTVDGCDSPHYGRSWCQKHWARWRCLGDPGESGDRRTRRRPLADRLWDKIDTSGICWEWTANRDRRGYGRIGHGGKHGRHILAHRAVWESLVGPIPDGLELDHLCRNPPCVNPDHLEPVTHAENMRRGFCGIREANRQRSKTHCLRGHQFIPENTYTNPRGERQCRSCMRIRDKAYRNQRR